MEHQLLTSLGGYMFDSHKHFKKGLILGAALLALSVFAITPLRAQEDGQVVKLLAAIKEDTGNILQIVNTFPAVIQTYIAEWYSEDKSTSIPHMLTNFGKLNTAVLNTTTAQMALQNQLLIDFFGGNPKTVASAFPGANDVSASTLLNNLFLNPDPRNNDPTAPQQNPVYNYIKNASGLNITHVRPALNWRGPAADQARYINYYNAMSAVQTYNAYVMSQFYDAPDSDGATISNLQSNLLAEASDAAWFKEVESENIGWVLRQLLIFTAQNYALSIQSLQTQKQLLATQVMTNTLLIIGNQFTESNLLTKASGATGP